MNGNGRIRYFYGAGHEQFPPSVLLRHAQLAEEAGFDGIACSDHYQPWWEPGESGQAWIWLGAAAQATAACAIGPAVTPALKRYHPALVAQAFATFEEMFPGRTFLAMGSGESLNESPLGCDWPDGKGQLAAMEEALWIIRRLWDGETLTEQGRFFETKAAKLHTRPEKPPPLYVSAFHPEAARLAARYGDGLWTLANPEAPKLIEIYRAQRDEDGRDAGEIILQASFSWDEDEAAALEGARVWKGAQPAEYYVEDWHDPKAMYANAEATISDADYKQLSIISSDADEHVRRLLEIEALGPTVISAMNCSGNDPEGAIRVYRDWVLPALRRG
ncbi:MAG TPA: TIGR03557 family F420-dependent LLM class oxidoreductase [Gaiellaceae bacterium]|nr:TIGR03557 family F420-dependent LLM class oxidoreductase [Gaiellaceae bacterium]